MPKELRVLRFVAQVINGDEFGIMGTVFFGPLKVVLVESGHEKAPQR